jgi:hypothetical protein
LFRLQRSVPTLTIVADTFHTKPLRRILQSIDRYQVLGLSLQELQLFEGNRDELHEIDAAPGVPRTITEVLGQEQAKPHKTVISYRGVGRGSSAMRLRHGGAKDETADDAERFFRAIDHGVLELHSRPSRLPLILAALPEHHDCFRKISHNPFLLSEGLAVNPDVLPIDELKERAWQVVEPQYQVRLAKLIEEFKFARSKGLGSGDLAQITEAANAGRVAMLLIEAGSQNDRRNDGAAGQAGIAEPLCSQIDDQFDTLSELVEQMGGQVRIISAEQMPERTGLAATYRY